MTEAVALRPRLDRIEELVEQVHRARAVGSYFSRRVTAQANGTLRNVLAIAPRPGASWELFAAVFFDAGSAGARPVAIGLGDSDGTDRPIGFLQTNAQTGIGTLLATTATNPSLLRRGLPLPDSQGIVADCRTSGIIAAGTGLALHVIGIESEAAE